MNILRPFWINRINAAWKKNSIVWLQGVRRAGKTTLAKSFAKAEYLNCDLSSTQEILKNPELFFKNCKAKVLILDEVHQLEEASTVLKIAADEFSHIKILATGSSTLIASKKFKDSLTGRKRNIHLTPILIDEISNFDSKFERRILFGGLPPALLSKELDLEFYSEWMDSFYARDIQELFAVEKRQPFLKALEYLLVSNANLFEVTKLAQASGISRPTAIKYLEILELTNAITVIRPFSQNSEQELVSQPKVYGFDTGFCCFTQGIRALGPNDKGHFLENIVLESFQAYGLAINLKFWRTKSKKELDFIYSKSKDDIIAIECKWKERNFSDEALQVFRSLYPKGENWIITTDSISRIEKHKDNSLRFIHVNDLSKELEKLK